MKRKIHIFLSLFFIPAPLITIKYWTRIDGHATMNRIPGPGLPVKYPRDLGGKKEFEGVSCFAKERRKKIIREEKEKVKENHSLPSLLPVPFI